MWNQDPVVKEIGIRQVFLPNRVYTGPKDARIAITGMPVVTPNVFGDLIIDPAVSLLTLMGWFPGVFAALYFACQTAALCDRPGISRMLVMSTMPMKQSRCRLMTTRPKKARIYRIFRRRADGSGRR
jgi:hypothetical protein